MILNRKSTADLSVPKSVKVGNYEIRKMPIGAYLKAMETLKNFPDEFMAACFPGMELQAVLDHLKELDAKSLEMILQGALVIAPGLMIDLIADLSGIKKENLIEDESIGLDGLIDIVFALIEVNRLGECGIKVKALIRKAKSGNLLNTGSSD